MSIKNFLMGKRDRTSAHFNLSAFAKSYEQIDGTQAGQLSVGAEHFSAALEGFGDVDGHLGEEIQGMYRALEDILGDPSVGFEHYNQGRGADADRVASNQITAALLTQAALTNARQWRNNMAKMAVAVESADPNVINVRPMLDGPAGSLMTVSDAKAAMENYNEKSQRDFRVVSVGYSLTAARQDAFGEAAYPTVVVNPTEGGVTQNLTYVAVMRDVYHQTTGALFDTQEVNLVEAFRDPSILEDFSTACIPVVNEQDDNTQYFIPAGLVAPIEVEHPNTGPVRTAPLRPNTKLNLIGISNQQQLLNGHYLDISDTLDSAMWLKSLYVQTGDGVVRFNVRRMPTAVFQPALQSDTRNANLAFMSDDLLITADTTTVEGTALANVPAGWSVRVSVQMSGTVSLSKGSLYLSPSPVEVSRVYDEEGTSLALTGGAVAAMITALGDMAVVGYELDARFTNTNRRNRGQLLQTRALQFRYPIPMHAPITLPMSTMDEAGPGDVVKFLTAATNVRNSANAVTRLLNYCAQLREYVGAGFTRPKFGQVEGALSAVMRPTYRHASLDLRDAVDSIKSQDRFKDVCESILNVIRSMMFTAYRDSNIQAAFQTITGNADERPKAVILTSSDIANYLMHSGDDRALGAYLKYDIVATNNERMDGKIVVILTREKPVENDILNWGTFYYVPTIVADLPISRHGQISREIAAVPFNLHVNNIPFALEIDVEGLEEVMSLSQFNARIGGGSAAPTTPEEPVEEPPAG
jgi:hypothetical protein